MPPLATSADQPRNRAIPSADKRLDQMDRLADMAHFPPLVNAGATANILLTITVIFVLIRWLPTSPLADVLPIILLPTPLLIVGVFLFLNLAPVLLLRALDARNAATPRPIPTLQSMNFVHDQHRFSSWVYLAASANMAFWILISWSIFLFFPTRTALLLTLAAAFLVTFSPVLLRSRRG